MAITLEDIKGMKYEVEFSYQNSRFSGDPDAAIEALNDSDRLIAEDTLLTYMRTIYSQGGTKEGLAVLASHPKEEALAIWTKDYNTAEVVRDVATRMISKRTSRTLGSKVKEIFPTDDVAKEIFSRIVTPEIIVNDVFRNIKGGKKE